MTEGSPWRPLSDELDRWRCEGRTARFWLRDDDAVLPSPALDRLAQLSERFAAPVLLAVIPMRAEPALALRLRASPCLLPCQHGAFHRSHAPAGAKNAEFGANRPVAEAIAEIAEGRARMGALFGDAALPVFVPPWNRIGEEIAAGLPMLGIAGLSCFRGFALGPSGGPALANTHLDIIDWHGGRKGRDAAGLAAELAGHLAAGRRDAGGADGGGAGAVFGLLLHHRDHDETAWSCLAALLGILCAHPAADITDPRELFPGHAPG